MTFESKHPVAQVILDAVLATSLVVVAAAFADGLTHAVTPAYRWMYAIWFAIGGIPCLLYMRYRGVVQFDRWDILAFAPMPLVLGIVPTWIDYPYNIIAMGLLLHVCYWIRALFPPADSQALKRGQVQHCSARHVILAYDHTFGDGRRLLGVT